ncbi:hypothetical protein [Actinomadura sp. 9N215]|uniref:hypothetical protein n=1 Tax=Actinomadura sp. 9N215 TaxID=3375150 RepID=UPI0037A649FC
MDAHRIAAAVLPWTPASGAAPVLRVVDPGMDARKRLTGTQVTTVARRHARDEELAPGTARAEAVRLTAHG